MVKSISVAFAASCFLLPPALADGLYSKSSAVLQVSGSSYDSLIAKSNYTSIVEFYAPWCGHCQNLKPAYEKAAKSLTGLAKVAAVNCDEESNKPFCGSMGVQGFPTLKIVKPSKKPGRPIVEDYQGQRTAKAITDAVLDKIPNHVKRLKDNDYQAWLEDGDGSKAILFSEKGAVSALLKAVAIDFLGNVAVGQARSSEKQIAEVFQVSKYPSLVLLPGGGKEPVVYDGEMKKDGIVSFLSQAASPNPDPAPKKAKSKPSSSGKSEKSKASKASSSFAKASASHASSEAKTDAASQTLETLEEASQPTASPNPEAGGTDRPIKVPWLAPPIPLLAQPLALQQKCLNNKAGTCVLALLPANTDPRAILTSAVASLSEVHEKYVKAGINIFPFYQVPDDNELGPELRKQLSISDDQLAVVALNAKRGWSRIFDHKFGDVGEKENDQARIEEWIDAIRMGDLPKSALPDSLVQDVDSLPKEPVYVKMPTDQSDPEAMKEALKGQLPEGVEFEFEEIDDNDYERIIRETKEAAAAREKAGADVVEEEAGRESDEPIEHIEL